MYNLLALFLLRKNDFDEL